MKKVTLYCDGGCRGNGKKGAIGGYGLILMYGEHEVEVKQAFKNTTNNQMELAGLIKGLSLIKEPCEVDVYSDSAYVINAINNNWLTKWQMNNWRTSDGSAVKNRDLWERLLEFMDIHYVHFHKVKGHAMNTYNNRCDALANEAMDMLENK
jgi:ribonuclease HI